MRAKINSKSRFSIMFLTLIIGLGLFFYPINQAHSLEWYEQLISDWDFINQGSMSQSQIQDFLISKGSVLATYSWNGKSAASWIYDESQEHGINPQVIIVTIQKEEGLIDGYWADPARYSQTRLDWAMGFGAFTGCGADGGWCTQYQGFGNQIHSAARRMKELFDAGGSGSRIVGATVPITTRSWESGITMVYLSNRATAVLYIYTPYIYNGNASFYNFFHNWFSSGSYVGLVKGDSDPLGTVYLIQNGIKYPVDYSETFYAWGFSWDRVSILSQSMIDGLPGQSGGPTPGDGWIRQIVKNETNTVYKINNAQKKWVVNQDAATLYGIDMGSATSLPDGVISILTPGLSFAKLVKGSGPAIYLIENGQKRWILNQTTMNSFQFNWSDVNVVDDGTLSSYPEGGLVSNVVKGNSDAVYLIDEGKKKMIYNLDIAKNWGFFNDTVSYFSDSFVSTVANGSVLKRLAKGPGPTLYLIDLGQKHPVPNLEISANWGFRNEDVAYVSDSFLDTRPTGGWVKRLAKSSGPTIYLMDQDQKKPIPDIPTFYNWNFHFEDVLIVSDEFLSFYRPGKWVKNTARAQDPAVYFIERGSKRLIPDPPTFNRLGLRWEDILPVSNNFLYFYPLGALKTR